MQEGNRGLGGEAGLCILTCHLPLSVGSLLSSIPGARLGGRILFLAEREEEGLGEKEAFSMESDLLFSVGCGGSTTIQIWEGLPCLQAYDALERRLGSSLPSFDSTGRAGTSLLP